jgi:hypothetical protein
MKKKIIFISAIFLVSFNTLNAQDWSKEDSLWIKNIIDGKEELKLNEETLKAIEEGKLIIPSWMKNEEDDIQKLIKDFEGIAQRDSSDLNRINPLSMPPAVFALYVLYIDKIDSINANATILLSESEKERLREALPPGNATIYGGNLGTGTPGGILLRSLDFNHVLSMIFSSQYRRLQYNKKHATAYKFYYDENALQPSFKWSESEKRRLNKDIQNQRKVNLKIKTSPNRMNGIDD